MKYKLLFVLVSVLLLATLCYTATVQYRQTTEYQGPGPNTKVQRVVVGVVGDEGVIQMRDKDGNMALELAVQANGDSRITLTNVRTTNRAEITNDGNGVGLLIQEQRKSVRYTVRGTEILPEM